MQLTLKTTNCYNIEKCVEHTLILKAHITNCELIAYQRIQAPFKHETKATK